MISLIGFFLLAIFISFMCSIWEAVILSVTPTYIKRKEKQNPPAGKLLAALKSDIDRPLSAVLTLNTFAHTIGAIGVGSQAGKLFGSRVIHFMGFSLTYEALIAALMTLAILFLSEIIPKTLGANNWRSLAVFTARSLKMLIILIFPFVWLSNHLTRILKKDKDKSVFSKQDFSALADVVKESGQIDKKDYTLIKNALRYDDLVSKDVMTPRTVMFAAEEGLTLRKFYTDHNPIPFSRIPVFQTDTDAISGLVLKHDLLQALVEGQDTEPLKSIARPPIIVPESMPLPRVFEKLNGKREHLAVVVDEYGSVSGLISIEDIVETLMGLEIMDETDSISDLQKYARQMWEERARDMGLI